MNETLDPLGLYKLHGCIDYYTDESIPLILSTEQYARLRAASRAVLRAL